MRLFAALLGQMLLGFACVAVAATPADRLHQPINNANLTRLKGSLHPLARGAADQGKVDGSTRMERMKLVFQPTAAQQRDLDALLSQQQDPDSPNYHRWLTPEQYGDRFGLSPGDIAKAAAWLRGEGFSIAEIARGRTYVAFNGTASQVEAAFHTEIHQYVVHGERHYANATEPSLPAELAKIVSGVASLHNFSPKPRLTGPQPRVTSSYSGNHFMQPGDFATIYDLMPLYFSGIDGTGQILAVVGQSDLVTDSSGNFTDVITFRTNSGLPLPAGYLTTLLVPGYSDPGIVSGDIVEANLDVEWSGGIAKGASIQYVVGNATTGGGAFDALIYAVQLNQASVISVSYGLCEPQIDANTQNLLTQAGQQANTQGQTIVGPTGDRGAADCEAATSVSATTGLAVDFPASSPYFTAAGGTEFFGDDPSLPAPGCLTTPYWACGTGTPGDTSATAIVYIPETVWNDTASLGVLSAGGGGISTLFPQPTWQIGLAVSTNGMRGVPDISLSGSPEHDGYLICSQGSCACGFRDSCTITNTTGTYDPVGGTSASAPAFAAIVALINQQTQQRQGNVNPTLYSMAINSPLIFHDITTGSNMVPCTQGTTGCPNGGLIGYNAGPGYDLATGLGSVDAGQLVSNWAGPHLVTLFVAPAPLGDGTVISTDGQLNCGPVCSANYVTGTAVTLTATPISGWTFTGWTGCDSGWANACVVTVTKTLPVVANFTPNQNVVTLTVGPQGSGFGSVISDDMQINCGGYCSGSYAQGTSVMLTASATFGSSFAGWTGCDFVSQNKCTVSMGSSRTASPIFTSDASGLRFVPVSPCRIVDTRNAPGTFGWPPIYGGTSRDFPLPQTSCNGVPIPATAAAYSLNITVVPQQTLGYLTVWPTGLPQPFVSTLNSTDGRIKASASIMPAGSNGAISVFATNNTDLIIDINGYFEPTTDTSALAFYPLAPCRVVDTRNPNGPLGGPYLSGNVGRDFPVLSSACGLPSNAQAYSMNFTAVPHGSLGYLTVWPSDQAQPYVSTLNAPTGQTTANAAIVPAASFGDISAFASNDTDLVIDVNGYFAAPGSGGLSLYPLSPCRVLDTRNGSGTFSGELTVNVASSPCGVSGSAQAYVLNATVVPASPLGYLSLWPDQGPQPYVSTLNANDGAITSNLAIVPTSNGSIDAFASSLTDLILDISSYFAP